MSGIQTASGRYFNLSRPHESDVHLEDIAAALSKLCRFTGHTKKFYSVADHSVLVSILCPHHPATALLHDAHEAYLGDISTPLKQELMTPYRTLQSLVDRAIEKRFDVRLDYHVDVKAADTAALLVEADKLLRGGIDQTLDWPQLNDRDLMAQAREHFKVSQTCQAAEQRFLKRAKEIGLWDASLKRAENQQ